MPCLVISYPTNISDKNYRTDNNNMSAEDIKNIEWTLGSVYYNGHNYTVKMAKANDEGTYCMSVQKYESYEFQELFGFNAHCQNYKKDKIILVRNKFFY